jgi:hypothetical protein
VTQAGIEPATFRLVYSSKYNFVYPKDSPQLLELGRRATAAEDVFLQIVGMNVKLIVNQMFHPQPSAENGRNFSGRGQKHSMGETLTASKNETRGKGRTPTKRDFEFQICGLKSKRKRHVAEPYSSVREMHASGISIKSICSSQVQTEISCISV